MIIIFQQWDCVWCLCLCLLACPCSCTQVLPPSFTAIVDFCTSKVLSKFFSSSGITYHTTTITINIVLPSWFWLILICVFRMGTRVSMMLSALTYTLYMSQVNIVLMIRNFDFFGEEWWHFLPMFTLTHPQLLYLNNYSIYVASALLGLGGPIIWTAQGTFLANNSKPETITRYLISNHHYDKILNKMLVFAFMSTLPLPGTLQSSGQCPCPPSSSATSSASSCSRGRSTSRLQRGTPSEWSLSLSPDLAPLSCSASGLRPAKVKMRFFWLLKQILILTGFRRWIQRPPRRRCRQWWSRWRRPWPCSAPRTWWPSPSPSSTRDSTSLSGTDSSQLALGSLEGKGIATISKIMEFCDQIS